ncbi:C4-dicarboxylate transporter DctA [Streptomyces sp. NBC_01799]|uniref:C4-dicarboxylate transporter DctA n=1 Tax=Streptomyces sp. NBC_01800 TaxID=2975945 RepID=UPI002DD8BABC|nr:C4-dicarboxylate transporter DctA [Streptomyces sp. NBC_01800]WSA72637.1 C4-dicarboxylate transporter DctA [Streptomyces sp. NBC_01800]WSA81166.1 C4-dicarboxylate transporter DctA [Streptomyces sp. NBC_01799]
MSRNDAAPGTVTAPPSRIRRLLSHLYIQCLIGVIAGAMMGWLWPTFGAELKPLGDGFIALVKMMIAPIIFCTVVHGIASMDNLRAVGRVSLKALIYFEVLTTVAMVIGLVVVNIVKPGSGLHIDVASLSTKGLPPVVSEHEGFADFLLAMIPATLVSALTGNEILPVLLVSVLFGFGLHASGEAGLSIARGVEKFSTVLFTLIRWIMRLAPIGAFGSMAFTIGNYGLNTLRHLALLVGSFWLTALFFVLVVLGTVMRLNGLRILPFLRYIKDELLIVLGTSSTEPVLPRMMAKLQHVGASKPVVGITLPAGYSFNLDGTAIYLTMGSVFLAQALGIDLSLTQQLSMLAIMLFTSKGAAGVTGSGFIALAATLSAIPHVPVAALALIFGIDRFMSEARALTSLVGNGVATLAVAGWEGQLDRDRAKAVLRGEIPYVPAPVTPAAEPKALTPEPAREPVPSIG